MFYEYALIPDIFDPTLLYCDAQADTIVTELLREAGKSGMVASLHKGKWQEHVTALVAGIPASDTSRTRTSPRGKLQDCLELLHKRNRLVRHPLCPVNPTCDKHWLDAAKRSHNDLAFDGIVMCQELFDRENMHTCQQAVPLHRALDAQFWTEREPGVTLKEKRKNEFRRVLAPVLRHAKAVTLIDPHIDPTVDRWKGVVELIGELTGKRACVASNAGWSPRIRINAGDPAPVATNVCLNDWGKLIDTLPSSFSVEVFLWQKNMIGPPPHDRFIITNQCGVTCPGGLDCYDDDDAYSSLAKGSSTWSLMSFSSMAHHLGEYAENSSPYKLLDSRTFKPAGC